MPEELVAFTIRLPVEMEKQIVQRGKAARRLRAAQVVFMLEAYLDQLSEGDFRFLSGEKPGQTGT